MGELSSDATVAQHQQLLVHFFAQLLLVLSENCELKCISFELFIISAYTIIADVLARFFVVPVLLVPGDWSK